MLPRREWNLIDPDVLAWRLEASPDEQFFTDVNRAAPDHRARGGRARGHARDGRGASSELGQAFEAMRAALGEGDADAYLTSDLRFHSIILEACHNELLEQMATMLRAVFRALFIRTVATRARGAALARGDPRRDPRTAIAEAAEQATRVLIDDTASGLTRTRASQAGA